MQFAALQWLWLRSAVKRHRALTAVIVVALALAAYGAPPDVPPQAPWLPLVTALGGGSIGALIIRALMIRSQRREMNANAAKSEADAIETSARTARDVMAELDELWGKWRDERDRADRLDSEVRQLREIVSVVLTANRVRDPNAFGAMFDLEAITFGVIFASSLGGRFERVNRGLCRLLGRTKDEIQRIGWLGLVAPEDLEKTRAMQAATHYGPVRDFHTNFVHADGSLVPLNWHALSYEDGTTMAFAFPARRAEDIG